VQLDFWGKWRPGKKPERSGIPLTDGQRRLTGALLLLILTAVLMLQLTSHNKDPSPAASLWNTPSSTNGGAEPALGGGSAASPSYEEQVERKLAAILSRIEGVGSVEVMVSLSTGSRLELAQDIDGDETVTEETDTQGGKRRVVSKRWNERVVVIRDGQKNGDSPIVLAEHRPLVAGVLVVADGAKDPTLRLLISRAVETAIGVPPHRVTVVPRRK